MEPHMKHGLAVAVIMLFAWDRPPTYLIIGAS